MCGLFLAKLNLLSHAFSDRFDTLLLSEGSAHLKSITLLFFSLPFLFIAKFRTVLAFTRYLLH